jgi:hypothetical protein
LFIPKKYELVYITSRIKGIKIDVIIKLKGIKVKLKTLIRVLGLILNSKLN